MDFITDKTIATRLLGIFILLMQCFQLTAGDGGEWIRVINLEENWKFSIGDDYRWASSQYDDTKWEDIEVPSTWEDEGFYGYDGFAWYRHQFDGRKIKPTTDFYLGLGYIDDVDEVYVNGKLIGFSGEFPPHFHTAYKARRMYPIPASYINWKGPNTIAVRVYDTHLEGGIIAGDIGVFYRRDDWVLDIDLKGVWQFRPGNNPDWSGVKYRDDDWEHIMVPYFWEDQGFEYDGVAWYRKAFFVPRSLEGEDMVLLIGKIDDFDLSYLNGKFIGSTNDGKSYGRSTSWLKQRAYELPTGSIRFGAVNYLAIQVKDIGNDGGIYQGPIGLIRKHRLKERGFHW